MDVISMSLIALNDKTVLLRDLPRESAAGAADYQREIW